MGDSFKRCVPLGAVVKRGGVFRRGGFIQRRGFYSGLGVRRGGSDEAYFLGFFLAGGLGGFCWIWGGEEVPRPNPALQPTPV